MKIIKPSQIAVGMAALVLVAGCATERGEGGGETDETVTLAEVPAAVRETIKGFAAEAEIKKIEKGDVDGKVAYEFEIAKNGRASEVTIYPDGKLLGTEEPVALAEVPDAARRIIEAHAADGKLVSTEKVVEHGKTVYEAVVEKNGRKTEYVVAPDGKLIETEAVKPGKD